MKRGFTLIELSVVLVIIGLLVAGIMTGHLLLESARLQRAVRDFEEVNTSLMTFIIKYNALPGDMANATGLWGQYGFGGETENGDGNGQMDDCSAETRRVFNHLSLAGLTKGDYSPNGLSNPNYDIIGQSFPLSALNDSYGLKVSTLVGLAGGSAAWAALDGLHVIKVHQRGANCLGGNVPLYSGNQMWQFDLKFDDGKPGKGKIIGRGSPITCIVSSIDANTDYATSSSTQGCSPWYRLSLK